MSARSKLGAPNFADKAVRAPLPRAAHKSRLSRCLSGWYDSQTHHRRRLRHRRGIARLRCHPERKTDASHRTTSQQLHAHRGPAEDEQHHSEHQKPLAAISHEELEDFTVCSRRREEAEKADARSIRLSMTPVGRGSCRALIKPEVSARQEPRPTGSSCRCPATGRPFSSRRRLQSSVKKAGERGRCTSVAGLRDCPHITCGSGRRAASRFRPRRPSSGCRQAG